MPPGSCNVPGCGHSAFSCKMFTQTASSNIKSWQSILQQKYPNIDFKSAPRVFICKCHIHNHQLAQYRMPLEINVDKLPSTASIPKASANDHANRPVSRRKSCPSSSSTQGSKNDQINGPSNGSSNVPTNGPSNDPGSASSQLQQDKKTLPAMSTSNDPVKIIANVSQVTQPALIQSLISEVNRLKKENEILKKYLSRFTRSQIKILANEHVHDYDDETKIKAINLFGMVKEETYEYIRKNIAPLPSSTSVHKWVKTIGSNLDEEESLEIESIRSKVLNDQEREDGEEAHAEGKEENGEGKEGQGQEQVDDEVIVIDF